MKKNLLNSVNVPCGSKAAVSGETEVQVGRINVPIADIKKTPIGALLNIAFANHFLRFIPAKPIKAEQNSFSQLKKAVSHGTAYCLSALEQGLGDLDGAVDQIGNLAQLRMPVIS
jgi:hypothetical protein